MALFEPVFRALNDTGARYVVVGGLATVPHGYARVTADADLVVDLGWQAVTWDGNRDALLDSTLTATPARLA